VTESVSCVESGVRMCSQKLGNNVACDYCGTLVYKQKCVLEKTKNHFCNDDCRLKYYFKTPEQEKQKRSEYSRRYYEKNRTRLIKYQIDRNNERKISVLTYYGNGRCACVMCGFDDIDCLNIDHIDNNGAEVRRNGHRSEHSGSRLYNRLVHNNYPEGFQTLCANCNLKKEIVRKREKTTKGELRNEE